MTLADKFRWIIARPIRDFNPHEASLIVEVYHLTYCNPGALDHIGEGRKMLLELIYETHLGGA